MPTATAPTASSTTTAPSSWRQQLDAATVDAVVARLAAACAAGERVLIAGHVRPDGDALGSALALHLALSAAGARTTPAIGEDPAVTDPSLAGLPGLGDLVGAAALPPADEVDLVVTVDAASPGRLGAVADLLAAGVPSVVLDHHARSTPFGDLALVAPDAAATVQVVELLLTRLALPLTREVATCLYVGLVTDTGRFGYAATDPDVHLLASRLLAAGVAQDHWHQQLFDTRSFASVTLIGVGLARATLVPEVALVHTHLTAAELAAAGTGAGDLIDQLRTAASAEVALTLTEDPAGAWHGSLRSRGRVDVGRVAAAFGGGGHRLAAGFTAAGDADAITARVVDLLGGA